MRLFFYGTLLDRDVQSLVLGRPIGAARSHPAVLRHFRRVYVAGRLYPLLLPHRGGAVDGLVADGLSSAQINRIRDYEGGDYRLERHKVVLLRPGEVNGETNRVLADAWLFRSRPDTRPSSREWRLAAWRDNHKAAFLREARAWLGAGQGDGRWQAARDDAAEGRDDG